MHRGVQIAVNTCFHSITTTSNFPGLPFPLTAYRVLPGHRCRLTASPTPHSRSNPPQATLAIEIQ